MQNSAKKKRNGKMPLKKKIIIAIAVLIVLVGTIYFFALKGAGGGVSADFMWPTPTNTVGTSSLKVTVNGQFGWAKEVIAIRHKVLADGTKIDEFEEFGESFLGANYMSYAPIVGTSTYSGSPSFPTATLKLLPNNMDGTHNIYLVRAIVDNPYCSSSESWTTVMPANTGVANTTTVTVKCNPITFMNNALIGTKSMMGMSTPIR